MLTSDDMARIIIEVVTGKPAHVHSPEADRYRETVTKELVVIRAKGGIVDIPAEIEV